MVFNSPKIEARIAEVIEVILTRIRVLGLKADNIETSKLRLLALETIVVSILEPEALLTTTNAGEQNVTA